MELTKKKIIKKRKKEDCMKNQRTVMITQHARNSS